jgi:uncharacterized OsmC-like protein
MQIQSTTQPQSSEPNTLNGVDIDHLTETIEAVKENPALAHARFRASNTWVSGAHNLSSVQGFYAAGGEDESRETPFVIASDEPPLLGGENHGANAVELALAALASCMTGTLANYAAMMGIKLEEVTAELEGDMNMQGIFGLDETTRRGLQHVSVIYRIKSPESQDRITELLGTAQKFSPLFDIFTNPVPVSIQLAE